MNLKSLLSLFLLTGSLSAQSQIISTIAGDGIAGYAGDGGPAILAKLDKPECPIFDGSGNLIFTDQINNRVRKISPSGIITTFAGTGVAGSGGDGGPATNAQLNEPVGIVEDFSGNFYVVEWHGYRVRKINSSGVISTFCGTGVAGFSGDGGPAIAAKFNGLEAIAIDSSGNIYLADAFNHRIRKVNTAGIVSTIAGTGIAGYNGDGIAATSAWLNYPYEIRVEPSGEILVADQLNHRIRKISTSGIISTFAGIGSAGFSGDGGLATAAEFNNPTGIFKDPAGNYYVCDKLNARVRKIDAAGIVTTIAGTGISGYSGDGGPAIGAQLNWPQSVNQDLSGNLYISDNLNHCIRKIGSIAPNHPPFFTNGSVQHLTLCVDETDLIVPLNSVLTINDSDVGQLENWSLYTAPSHGSVLAGYSVLSTGAPIVPVGLTYTAVGGYSGTDMFRVIVSDGIASDTVTVNVTINLKPSPGVISGLNTVCPGDSVALTESASGGIWSSSNFTITDISSGGVVAGLLPGNDTIIYTTFNSCGIASAIFPFTVRTYSECHTEVATLQAAPFCSMTVYPVPNNGHFSLLVSSEVDKPYTVEIRNLVGEKVYEAGGASNRSIDLDIPSGAGMYFISLRMERFQKTAYFPVIK